MRLCQSQNAVSLPALPTVSVVIATRDRADMLRACLASVRQSACMPHEIIIVDSASRDPAITSRIASEFGASLVLADVPGAGHARNLGARVASGEVIAFTDDDALVDFDWIGTLAMTFSDEAVDAIVGPVFVQASRPLEVMGIRAGFDPARDEARFCRSMPDWFDRLAFGAIGFGANLAVRRCRFQGPDLFRTCLGAGAPIAGDETYFLFNLVSNWGVVVNAPRAKVYHPPQPPERTSAIQKGALAYVMFLLAGHPTLLPHFARRLLRYFVPRGGPRRSVGGAPGAWSRKDLFGVAVAAPGLLLAAWRHERRVDRTRFASGAVR